MISLTNHDFQWGRSEVVIIYPNIWWPEGKLVPETLTICLTGKIFSLDECEHIQEPPTLW